MPLTFGFKTLMCSQQYYHPILVDRIIGQDVLFVFIQEDAVIYLWCFYI